MLSEMRGVLERRLATELGDPASAQPWTRDRVSYISPDLFVRALLDVR